MVDLKPCTPFGAEIDLNLARPLDDETANALRTLLDRHHLLIFRDQSVTHAQQVEFVSIFGQPLRSRIDGVGYITNEDVPDNALGNGELAFHSDLSFSPKPFDAISLHAVQVENGQSSTRFVDSTLAYRRLPKALQQRIDNYHAMHVFGMNLAGRNLEDLPDHLPRHVHPLIMRHPRTGEKILYVNYNQTARIMELDKEESDALIDELFGYSYPPDAILEHVWFKGDLLMWDNLALQHARGSIANVGIRRLQRAVVAEAGFYEQHPQFGKHELVM